MSLADWSGQTAIVTGGASGLGAATARQLAEDGLKVALFDLDQDRGEAHAKALSGQFFKVDVTDPVAVQTAVDQLENVRIAVNCAGIAAGAKTVSRGQPHDAALFQKTIQINLIGSFHVASIAAAKMVGLDPIDDDGSRGVIVNTASVAAFEGQIGQLAYAASKGGVVGMTLPMARDLADKGVRVCAVAPGLFLTPMLEGLPEEVQNSLGNQVPFPSRLGDPAELAAMVSHITQDKMLNGEVIRLDGAIRMAPR